MLKAWEKNPPGHWLIAARYGYKPPVDFEAAKQATLEYGRQFFNDDDPTLLKKRTIN